MQVLEFYEAGVNTTVSILAFGLNLVEEVDPEQFLTQRKTVTEEASSKFNEVTKYHIHIGLDR